jgi:GNAT superfamily N-acetyltransferase
LDSNPDILIAPARHAGEMREYEALLQRVFKAELDVMIDDANSETHATDHGTLLGRARERIVAGLKMFLGNTATGRRVPMEHDGVPIREYQERHHPDKPIYCEVCRVVIDPEFRRDGLHARLLEAAVKLLPQDGCHVVYWLAKRSQAVNSHRSLRGFGLEPKIVEALTIQRRGDDAPRERILSVIELPRVPGRTGF